MDERPEPTMTQVKIRCREELKRRLEAEAKAGKRSVNDVVISRLEDSYNNQDGYAAMIKERFGDEKSFKTLCAIASSWGLISTLKDAPWHAFPETVDMAMASATYTINLISSGLPERLPVLEKEEAEDFRKKLRLFVGYGAAKMALNSLEGRGFDEMIAKNLVSDLEELYKFDVVAWYEGEKKAGRVSNEQTETAEQKIKTE